MYGKLLLITIEKNKDVNNIIISYNFLLIRFYFFMSITKRNSDEII